MRIRAKKAQRHETKFRVRNRVWLLGSLRSSGWRKNNVGTDILAFLVAVLHIMSTGTMKTELYLKPEI